MIFVAYLRRKPKHFVLDPETRIAACGYEIPRRARWRLRGEMVVPPFVLCQVCRAALAEVFA